MIKTKNMNLLDSKNVYEPYNSKASFKFKKNIQE